MLLSEVKENRDVIRTLVEQYGASNIRLFGSVSRGEEGPDSDIDFLVEFPRGYDLLGQRIPLIEKLSSLLHRRVEVIPEHELNRYIRDQVLSEAVDL
ncbi:MAG TPA: nucleotidyltransferase [Gammaproteobacteria bacterium]|nr:nucleotidyltransferase [Gammaproteobacteria bacterium]